MDEGRTAETPGGGTRPPFFWVALALTLVDLVLLGGTLWVLFGKGGTTWSGGFSVQADSRGSTPIVATVRPDGNVAGFLLEGDRIVAIDGDRRVTYGNLVLFGRRFAAGPTFTVERDGAERDVALPPLLGPVSGHPGSTLVHLPPAFAFFLTGAAVGLARPRLRAAMLFATASLAAAPPILVRAGARSPQGAGLLEGWEEWVVNLSHFPSPLHVAIALAFLFVFPSEPVLGRGWQVLRRAMAGVGLTAWAASLFADVAIWIRPDLGIEMAWANPRLWSALNDLVNFYPGLAFSLMVLVVVAKVRGATEYRQRQQLFWMVAGAVLGLLPLAVYFLLRVSLIWLGGDALGILWMSDVATVTLTAAPVAMAYAIVRHRIFDIRVVVRRGLQYLLALNSLRVAVAAPVLVLGWEVARDPTVSVVDLVSKRPVVWLALATALGLLAVRARLVSTLDRRFFRSRYEPETILLSLLRDVDSSESPRDRARAAAAHIETSLHPEGLEIFLREEGDGPLHRQHQAGEVPAEGTLSADSALVKLLDRTGEPESAAPSLVVPVGGGERRLYGLIRLGPRKSDEAYSDKDLHLLEAIAGELLITQENASLRRRMGEERRVREEVLARLDEQGVNLVRECPACGACFDREARTCPADGQELALTHPVEHVVDGRWRLERRLGAGGMGTVYEATDLRLQRSVALKLMHPRTVGDEAARRRFEREARALARLQHPHLVSLFDFGSASTGGAFLIMELVPGDTLRAELSGGGPLPPASIARWFDQVLDGVSYAHRSGVIHRDLKPENVVLAAGPGGARTAKILDFGLARLRGLGEIESTAFTASGVVMGTMGYMAPEQLLGTRVDERADVFSLGVILVEALTGRHPFRKDDPGRTLAAVLYDPIRLPGDDPRVRTLEQALLPVLAKDPGQRIASVDEMRARVIPALRDSPRLDRPGPGSPPAPPTITALTRPAGPDKR